MSLSDEREFPPIPDSTIRELTWMPSVATAAQIKAMALEIQSLRASQAKVVEALRPFKEALVDLDGEMPPDLQAPDDMPIGAALWEESQPTCGDLRRLIAALAEHGGQT